MMHLIHRNRVIETRTARFRFRCGLICLQISSHSGVRLISVVLIDKSKQDGRNHCLHRNGQPNEKDARPQGVPRGEAGAVGD